jgi:hypothetical protein
MRAARPTEATERCCPGAAQARCRYKLKVGAELERQLPNLKFLGAADCELDAGLSAAEARVRKLLVIYPDGDRHERWIRLQADLGALTQVISGPPVRRDFGF